MDHSKRLTELNTKAYYLIVALAFLYSGFRNPPTWSLKTAITLTAVVAVLPIQDYPPESWMNGIRWFKVIVLTLAFAVTLDWIWCV